MPQMAWSRQASFVPGAQASRFYTHDEQNRIQCFEKKTFSTHGSRSLQRHYPITISSTSTRNYAPTPPRGLEGAVP